MKNLFSHNDRDKDVVNKFFTMVCVRLFLERQEESIQKFISDFKRLTAADEKVSTKRRFLVILQNMLRVAYLNCVIGYFTMIDRLGRKIQTVP